MYINFVAVTVAIAITIAFFKWKYTYWKRKGVPNPSPIFPFGNLLPVVTKKLAFFVYFKNLYDFYKSQGLRYFGCYIFTEPVLIMIDLDLIKRVLVTDFQHFTDHWSYNNVNDPLMNNLFTSKGLAWKNMRKKITPAFTSNKIKMMSQTMIDCSKGLVEITDRAAANHEVINLEDVFARFSIDIIGSCVYGIDCNTMINPHSKFRKYINTVFKCGIWEGLLKGFWFAYPRLAGLFKLRIIKKYVSKFFINIADEILRYRQENCVTRKDFLHLLIQLKNDANIKDDVQVGSLCNGNNPEGVEKSLTNEDVAAQLFVFFLGGFETATFTLSFCFYELAANIDLQEKLRNEITTVLDRYDGKVTYDALADMTYMDMCIEETLRKYPPGSFLPRICTKDYQIPHSNLTIKKGMQVFLPILGLHRDSEYYACPDEFDPDRFSPESKSKRPPFTWLPFGEGPRSCIAYRFGLLQTKVALTTLLKDYEFRVNSKTITPLVIQPEAIILKAQGGIWLNAKKINRI